MTEFAWLSATHLRDLYLGREVSPVEVISALLDRIDAYDENLHAFVTVTADLALRQARDAERQYRDHSTRQLPPLLGIPLSYKDLTPTRGIRTTFGSAAYTGHIPNRDALLVERGHAAGAVCLGKTSTSEWGWIATAGSRLGGPTCNPYDADKTAGGSSGGAAAAVATGMGPLAEGGDGAGSIRIPAAFCGILGFKPTYGVLPIYPPSANDPLTHHGPLTRTVGDAALWLDAFAGPDPRDRYATAAQGASYVDTATGPVAGLRLAWCPSLGFNTAEPHVLAAVEKTAYAFENLGCHVEEVDPRLDDPWPFVDRIWKVGHAARHASDYDEVKHLLDPGRVHLIDQGLTIRAVDYLAARHACTEYAAQLASLMHRYDALLTPTAAITAFSAHQDFPTEVAGTPTQYLRWASFTYPFNVTGQPAATLPAGQADDGLPVGLQVVGRWRDDATVLKLAAAAEKHQQ